MSILVTGATGFIGSYLIQLGGEFRCVVRPDSKHSFKDFFEVPSIDNSTDWSDCFDGVDAIIHLAALAHKKSYTEDDYIAVNKEGTLRLARKAAAAGVKRFVFVSSIGVNGKSSNTKAFFPSQDVKPHSSYASSKYEAELGLWSISKDTGLEVVIVRPTLVYGPEAPGNFGLLQKLVSKTIVLPFGLVKNRRDFISVQNLADLLLVCAKLDGAVGQTFLASESQTVSIKGFTNLIAKSLGKNLIQLPIPVFLFRFLGRLLGRTEMIEQLVGNLEVDSSNIEKVLGWKPPLSMEKSLAFLKDNN
ncbi:MAG: NAD-dependent epimerase/dehydratase family protein [Pseudoalteromonas nigrifaciens]